MRGTAAVPTSPHRVHRWPLRWFQDSTAGRSTFQPSTETDPGPSRKSRPATGGRPTQRAARTRSRCPWATQRVSPVGSEGPLDDPVGAAGHVPDPLAVGDALVPQCPSWVLLADLVPGETLESAVVPLDQIRLGRPGRSRGWRRSPTPVAAGWSGPGRSRSSPARRAEPRRLGLGPTQVQQREVAPTRVAAGLRPLGGPVADEDHPGRHGP